MFASSCSVQQVRTRAYARVRVSCCSCVIIHVILASISVSIALITIKSLTPACQWRNPSSPERGRAGFDSPARRHIKFYARYSGQLGRRQQSPILELRPGVVMLYRMIMLHMHFAVQTILSSNALHETIRFATFCWVPTVVLVDVRTCAWQSRALRTYVSKRKRYQISSILYYNLFDNQLSSHAPTPVHKSYAGT